VACDDEPQLELGLVFLLVQPVERRAKVVTLALEPVELIATQLKELGAIRFCPGDEERCMTATSVAGPAAFGEALERVLADRLEHREAAVSLADEALVDERGERFQLTVADGFGRFERPAAGKDR
jgi:hypothetical protein